VRNSIHAIRALAALDLPVLDALAVNGEPATANTLAFLLDESSVRDACERLISVGLVRWQKGRARPEKLEFRLTEAEQIVYDSVPARVRTDLHTRAAERSSGSDRFRHRVAASDGDDLQLAAELAEAAEIGADLDDAQAAQYLLWASRLGGTPQLAGRRLCEGVRMLVMAAHEPEALEHRDDVRDLDPSVWRSEALALLDFAASKVSAARDRLLEALEKVDGRVDPELCARLNLELAYASSTIGLGAETVRAATAAIELSSITRVHAIARGFLATGRALEAGAPAGIETLAYLPSDPNECTAEQLPQLVQRGILFGLVGRLDEAARDLSLVVRRDDKSFGRLLGMAPYIHLSWIQYMLGRWSEASLTLEIALTKLGTRGRSFDRSVLFSMSAILYAGQGDHEQAVEALHQAETSAVAADYIGPTVILATARAALAQSRGDFGEVARLLDQVGSSAAAADRTRLYSASWLPGEIGADIVLHRYKRARATLSRLAALPSQGAWLELAGFWLTARLAEVEGRYTAAAENYQKALNVGTSGGDPLWYRALLLHSYGIFCLHHGSRADGTEALESAAALFGRMGATPFLERCRQDLAAISAPAEGAWAAVLTSREREIALLVARGWTNPEIARELFVSPKTVEYHLRNSYMKLGMTNRRDLRDAIHDARA
jgi:DNA-binding CsgD family transcriptional regulator